MSKKQEGDGYAKPITAWAVEINGEVQSTNVLRTRKEARQVRNQYVAASPTKQLVKSAHVRKVQIEIVKGAR